jgi:hypothetical protein
MLLQLEVAKQGILIVRWVVDDPYAKLGRSGTDTENCHKQNGQELLSHGLLPFFPQRFEGMV